MNQTFCRRTTESSTGSVSTTTRAKKALDALHGRTKSNQARNTTHKERDHLWWVSGTVSTLAASLLVGPIFAGVAFMGAAFVTDVVIRGIEDSTEEAS